MLRRFLALILILGLALPALPAPALAQAEAGRHAVMVSTAHGCHDAAPAKQGHHSPQAKHECIGCIAPLHGVAMAAPCTPIRVALPQAELAAQLGHLRTGPEVPPPKS